MTDAPDAGSARQQIDNALAVIGASRPEDPRAARQVYQLATTALRAARAALDELDAQLDVATGPNRDSIEELLAAKRELDAAELARLELEQRLAMERAEREAIETVEKEERVQLKKLEKQNADFESRLLSDDDAFDRYFDKALDDEERKGRTPPKR